MSHRTNLKALAEDYKNTQYGMSLALMDEFIDKVDRMVVYMGIHGEVNTHQQHSIEVLAMLQDIDPR